MRTRRAAATIATLIGLLAFAPAASAHAELTGSMPEPGAELQDAPPEIRLTFSDELNPEASGFVLLGPDRGEVATGAVDLEVAERNELSAAVTLTEPGAYTVDWTAVAADGHPETGSFTFGYRSATVERETPDTALGQPAGTTLPIGALLLGLAAMLVAARGRRARAGA